MENHEPVMKALRKLVDLPECKDENDYDLGYRECLNHVKQILRFSDIRYQPCPTCLIVTEQALVELEGGENGSEWHCARCKQAVV